MTILDEPSGNQDESSPLKKDVEINNATSSVATAPPPYASIPTPSPNPIPSESSQAIPQTGPQSHRVITFRNRRSPIGRFLAAFGIAWLVLLLWSALVHSFNLTKHFVPVGRRHSYEYEADIYRQWQLQNGIDNTGRILPVQYPPIQPPQMME